MPRTLLAPSLSLSVSKCSTSFNMFLEFSGFLLCRQCGPIRWSHQASVCFGAWFDFVCARQWIVELLDRCIAHWLWSWYCLWQLLLLLALIWRHCHRYKTSFVSSTVPQYAVCPSGQGIAIGIRCAYFEYYKLSSSPLSLSLFLSPSLSLSFPLSLSNDRFFWVSGSAAGSKSVARCLVVGLWTLFGIINVCASAFGFAWNSLTTCNYLILLFVLRCR